MTRTRLTLILLALAALLPASPAQAHRSCRSIVKCRENASWSHRVVVDLNRRLAIANDRPSKPRDLPTCHTLASCRRLAARQARSRAFAIRAYRHLLVDNTPGGARRIVRYRFAPCGRTAQIQAQLIVGWESGWNRYSINAAGDTSWWQFERPAHPDISIAEAEDADWSTLRARRDSKCGRDWSPEWSSVRDHGRSWP